MPACPLVTVHLFGVPASGVGRALLRLAQDRRRLAATPGLSFFKQVGTGDGRTFDLRDAQPRRWGLVAAWDSAADLAAFERRSPVSAAWRRLAAERWRADLLTVRSRGSWSGRNPFPARGGASAAGQVAAITRARLRPARAGRFRRAVPAVALALRQAPGLRLAVAIGEWPVGLQGTFSVWSDAASLRAYAYHGQAHQEAIRRTATEGWYREELFARFAVLQTTGTVDGRDPAEPTGRGSVRA